MLRFTKYLLAALALAFIITACGDDLTSPVSKDTSKPAKQVYIVELSAPTGNSVQSVAPEQSITAFLNEYSISANSVNFVYTSVLNGFAAELSPEEMQKIATDKRVTHIEADQIMHIVGNTYAGIAQQTTPWGIDCVGGSVDANNNTGVAWIVDTGIDLDHPDLNVNASKSRTFVTTGQDKYSADDLNGHGSHCAGIIAAKNNTEGVVGVCAGATVIAVKVLNQNGSGSTSQIVAGIDYVGKNLVKNSLNVVNMSFGGFISPSLDNAVKSLANKGAKISIAAGNSGANVMFYSPARVNATNVYTVSAYTSAYALASWSNYGTGVDYACPGVNIYSCYKNAGYTTMSGTSMAAPHLAGILLANNGIIHTNGTITGDKDGKPDPIAVR